MGEPALGIDLGCTGIKWVRTDGERVLATGTLPTPADQDAILAAITGISADAGPAVIGVAVPGHVDRDSGVVRFLPNLAGEWAGFPLGATLAERTGRSVRVLNDARALCLAELGKGAARGLADVLFLTLGTGVGGGVVSGGRLLVGLDDRLGEIGHLTYDRAGPRCGCGNRGCLEMYASATALVAANSARGRELTAAEVLSAARAGDAVAGAVVAEAGAAIGHTLASLCALLPSTAVVIGGGLAGGLDVLRPHIEEPLRRRAGFIGPVRVLAAQLGTEAGAMGAAMAATATAALVHG